MPAVYQEKHAYQMPVLNETIALITQLVSFAFSLPFAQPFTAFPCCTSACTIGTLPTKGVYSPPCSVILLWWRRRREELRGCSNALLLLVLGGAVLLGPRLGRSPIPNPHVPCTRIFTIAEHHRWYFTVMVYQLVQQDEDRHFSVPLSSSVTLVEVRPRWLQINKTS